ncbi:hypothetical protein HDU77_008412 [Chytriomyces hyalinus]|nr:hypothetical protein HDU77_008412 [Chytriomyces hyalinus]
MENTPSKSIGGGFCMQSEHRMWEHWDTYSAAQRRKSELAPSEPEDKKPYPLIAENATDSFLTRRD